MSRRKGGKNTPGHHKTAHRMPGRIPPASDPARAIPHPPPAFPKGLVAPPRIGVTITSMAMPDRIKGERLKSPSAGSAALLSPPSAPLPTPASSSRPAPQPPDPPAITLPDMPEPLVEPIGPHDHDEATRLPDTMPDRALPRNRSLAHPSGGLVSAIGDWLGSFGRMVASGFVVKKRRAPLPRPPRQAFTSMVRQRDSETSLRERTEITQLRAENRRLRAQLDALDTLRQMQKKGEEVG